MTESISTVAASLFSDPEFSLSKKKIMDLVEKYSSKITQVRPPISVLSQSYIETIKIFNHYRASSLFYPYLGSGIGNGALVELADGSVKYDLISGVGVHFGHSHPKIIEACLEAAVQDIAMQGNLLQNGDAVILTDLLVKESNLDHCILTTSGAMANENALKLIFQKRFPATRILAFDRCFLGRTLALAQVTDRPQFREGLPPTLAVDYIPFYDWKDPKDSTDQAVSTLEKILKRYPRAHACISMELIQGEAGNYPGKTEFFTAILKIIKENGIAVHVDEIQTFGRTDRLFAYQHFAIEPFVDVVSVGKLLHTCATLFRKEYAPRPGLITQTFTSPTACIRAASAIIESLITEEYLGLKGKNMTTRKYIVDKLQNLSAEFPDRVEGPFGHGLMIAFTPLKGEKEKVLTFAHRLFEKGVITYTAGQNPMRIRFLIPAAGITFEHIDRVFEILKETLLEM